MQVIQRTYLDVELKGLIWERFFSPLWLNVKIRTLENLYQNGLRDRIARSMPPV